ncbi:vesicle-trafficking protein SEC22b-like isoform X2 [Rhineura floridana]|uniref:vesicle-trafficking protein SEC22b-like isoform X2 n=1 Tax=Rhineura floridana TaxID=261503 RepID=UPI002AC85713|nr:vesicle-trafficking protein SEC22b-like isoform X2 [Rhineura floridana]
MVLLTMISRVQDALLLAASMQETEQSNRNFQEYHNQAKQLFRKLGDHSPNRCSLQAGPMTFHYLISQGICYLTLCEAAYSKKLAFAFLEELQAEFWELYGKKVSSVSRPYAFIEFDIYIQKLKKSYLDTWSKRHLSHINLELQDVQKIMVTNIEELWIPRPATCQLSPRNTARMPNSSAAVPLMPKLLPPVSSSWYL